MKNNNQYIDFIIHNNEQIWNRQVNKEIKFRGMHRDLWIKGVLIMALK